MGNSSLPQRSANHSALFSGNQGSLLLTTKAVGIGSLSSGKLSPNPKRSGSAAATRKAPATRDLSWKPEYREALRTAIKTLVLLKRTDTFLDPDTFIDDRYIREAFKQSGLDYEKRLKNYAKLPLNVKDARTGTAISDPKLADQLWVAGEAKVRAYATPDSAFADQAALEKDGKKIRAGYVHDRNTGLKLFSNQAFYVKNAKGQIVAFLDKRSADAWAKAKGGSVVEYAALTGSKPGKLAAAN
jgi:NitT/TauT family transport system substrate-binding protein